MPFPPVDIQPGPKVLAAALKLAGFSDAVFMPAVTDKCGVTWPKPSQLQVSLAIVGAESSGHAGAYHVNADGSTDYGALQVNSKAHPEYFRPVTSPLQLDWKSYADNAEMAYAIFVKAIAAKKAPFEPWNAYTNGGYLSERFGGKSWLHWAGYGVTQMQAAVKGLMAAPTNYTELKALQQTASIMWDALRYWQ